MAAEYDHDSYSADWARQHLPDYGPEWRAAIDFGIHVTLLLENLELSPTERLERPKNRIVDAELQALRAKLNHSGE